MRYSINNSGEIIDLEYVEKIGIISILSQTNKIEVTMLNTEESVIDWEEFKKTIDSYFWKGKV